MMNDDVGIIKPQGEFCRGRASGAVDLFASSLDLPVEFK
jgi:hypothetical protein